MPPTTPQGWEPEPEKMGNWREMFEPRAPGAKPGTAPPSPGLAPEPPDEDGLALEMADYKPWIIMRGRSRPAMMLHMRRFEPKSGLWVGWALSYPSLIAAEYIGDRMVSLDFGTRQFVIEGNGLGELVGHLQQGTVLALREYSAQVWPKAAEGPFISSIQRVGAA